MKTAYKPISISPELAARFEGNDQAERMDAAFRAMLKVPHSAVINDTAKRKRVREETNQSSSLNRERAE